jgi:DnaK suppressor protein
MTPSPAAPKKVPTSYGKKELAHFEKRLLEERKRVLKELGANELSNGDAADSAYSFHMADQGTDAMEREKAFLFASKEGRFLWHLNQALRRLYQSPETFGKCHSCGNLVAFERLDALPNARYCIDCKQKEEDGKR